MSATVDITAINAAQMRVGDAAAYPTVPAARQIALHAITIQIGRNL